MHVSASRLPVGYLVFSLILGGALAPSASQAQSTRSMMSRVRALQQQERQQMIQTTQAQLGQARQALSKAETEVTTAASSVQTAKSKLEAAREQVASSEKEETAANKKMHEIEDQVLAAQTPDSEYGKAHAQLEAAQLNLDETVHRLLSLPPHAGPTTEQERATERLHLTADQKARLKDSADYAKANEQVHTASAHLADGRKNVLNRDSNWTAAFAARHSASENTKTLEGNAKAASQELAASQKQLGAANQVALAAKQTIAETESILLQLGLTPQAIQAAGAKPAARPAGAGK